MVDWNLALKIFVMGFFTVFICLLILMTAIKMVGGLFKRMNKVENSN